VSRKDDLLNELRSLIKKGTVSYTSASAVHDIYEGFVFAQVVETAREIRRARVHFQDVGMRPAKDLVFRASPGRLHSTGQAYTHAVIELGPGIPLLEAHIGVMVRGTSGVEHECDVLVLTAEEASICRQTHISPRVKDCVLAIECKYYTSPLPLSLGREFSGLKADLGTKPTPLFVASRSSATLKQYLNAKKLKQEFNILPNEENIRFLKFHIREAFKSHASSHNATIDI
jgi:hypothetical protein